MTLLHELAAKKFEGLNAPEAYLIESVQIGVIAWCGTGDVVTNFWDLDNEPGRPEWDKGIRHVRAELIEWICRDPEASQCVHLNGLQLGAAHVNGRLNLNDSTIKFGLRLCRCWIPEGVDVYFSRTKTLNFLGSHVGGLSGRRLTVNGDLLLGGGAVINREVNLRDAEVGRDFDCAGGRFSNQGATAIRATGLRVGRHVRLGTSHRRDASADRFECIGEIELSGSQIGGDIDCREASLSHPTSCSLTLRGARIAGSAEIADGFRSDGSIDLSGAVIGGRLNCSGAVLSGEGRPALLASDINVTRSVLMTEGFTALGEVNLDGGEIGGQLNCEAAWFSNPGNTALSLNGARVRDSIVLGRNFVSLGKVELVGAEIGDQLDCGGAYLANGRKTSIDLNGISVGRDVFLSSQPDESNCLGLRWGTGFIADGEIDFTGADIAGELNCSGGLIYGAWGRALTVIAAKIGQRVLLRENFTSFGEVDFTQSEVGDVNCSHCNLNHPGGRSFTGVRLRVSGNISFRDDAEISGIVNLRRAKISGDLIFQRVHFRRPQDPHLSYDEAEPDSDFPVGKNGLYANAMDLEGRLVWLDLEMRADTVLLLQESKIAVIADSEPTWPSSGNLRLDGCEYEALQEDGQSDKPAKVRLGWIARQPSGYKPQPYKQLAEVFRRSGREGNATTVLIERENAHRKALGQSLVRRLLGRSTQEDGLDNSAAAGSQHARDHLRAVRRWVWDASRWLVMWPLKLVVGNGYRPLQAFWPGIGLVLLGTVVFSYGYHHWVIVPADKESYEYFFSCAKSEKPHAYQEFSPLVYSLENFLPLIDLGQRKDWSPGPIRVYPDINCLAPFRPHRDGWFLSHMRVCVWIHTILGWFVAGMFAAGVTGLVRKE